MFSTLHQLATTPTASGMQARDMLHNIMFVTPTIATTQGPLMSNQRPSHRMGHIVNKEVVYSLTVTPATPTLPASSENNKLTPLPRVHFC
jgi:hypothetical protein